jgi:hypothetical protein
MATLLEFAAEAFGLLVNTLILIVITPPVGSIVDWFALFSSQQSSGLLNATPLKGSFGMFYGFLILIEIALVVRMYLVTIRRTDYATGEEDY